MSIKPLGRRVPEDFEHVEKYPLSSAAAVALSPTPVVIGVNWYSAFDRPTFDRSGHYVIKPGTGPRPLGTIRGGHCVCLKPKGVSDPTSWWDFYNQGAEGACVGFGTSRLMSLMNRRRYFARWLWDRAKENDEWSDTNPGDDNGTSVRAALDIMKNRGHVRWASALKAADSDFTKRTNLVPVLGEGIAVYRWVKSMDDLLEVLGYQGLDYVDVLNSWGRNYPHLTRFPLSVMEQLWRKTGSSGSS